MMVFLKADRPASKEEHDTSGHAGKKPSIVTGNKKARWTAGFVGRLRQA